jgi:ketosteroid isomerase-like protein
MSELEEFMLRCQEGLRHQVGGESEPLLELWSHAGDVAILGAIGSYARGWESVRTHLLGAAKSLNWTQLTLENVLSTAGEELAVSVNLERMTREVDGRTEGRTLRATQVYRREAGEWRLILRHANTVSADDEARERALLGGGG